MKRTLFIIIHLMSVLLFAAGLGVIHRYTREGTGISWIEDTRFEDSVLFSEMVADDIENIKRYAVLKNAFENEGDGELDTNKLVVTAVTSNGNMSYRLSDLVKQAARYGYTMDDKSHRISVSETGTTDEPYEIRVTYKAFDPFYFDNIEPGPSQGVTNIRDLSVEALRALAEYYRLRTEYGTDMTNFVYNMTFDPESDYDIMMYNTGKTTDEIMSLGKYLIVTQERTIETNIEPQPENILSDENSFRLTDYDSNLMEIGIDTTYMFNDRYKEADDAFINDIRTAKTWLVILAGSAFAALISLVLMVRGFDEEDRRELAVDRMPLEALVFVYACLAVILYFIFKASLNTVFEELLEYSDRAFWRDITKGVITWLLSVCILSSMYRRSVNGGCFKNSLLQGIVRALSSEKDGRPAWNSLKGYVLFTAVNVCGVVFILRCYGMTMLGSFYSLAMWGCMVLLIAFDIFAYVLRYNRFRQRDEIRRAVNDIAGGNVDIKLNEAEFDGEALEVVKGLNNISVGLHTAINEQVKADKLKADLITNVSHDIRTPLTSIINYVDLMKRENITDPKLKGYIDVLDKKSSRLKNLTEDLLEASKASSGNIRMEFACIDMAELAEQAGGEFEDKFKSRNLELELSVPEEAVPVLADGRHLWRVFENLYNNAAKYSMEGTRVYAEVRIADEDKAVFTIKNISEKKLNISPDELTERFVRGDVSRNTEGSGLGLSIAKSLTALMKGELKIEIDGDLYKASVIMDRYHDENDAVKEG